MNRRQFAGGCCAAAVSACAPVGPASPVTSLDAHATQLRDAFNRRSDLVRLVLLVSPT
jgi:hypothetical protein